MSAGVYCRRCGFAFAKEVRYRGIMSAGVGVGGFAKEFDRQFVRERNVLVSADWRVPPHLDKQNAVLSVTVGSYYRRRKELCEEMEL